jgi:hypothetical protein
VDGLSIVFESDQHYNKIHRIKTLQVRRDMRKIPLPTRIQF